MPRKKSAKKSAKTTTKSAFVRSLSPDLSAKEAVAAAAEAGITVTPKQVYNIRGAAKAKGGSSSPKKARVGNKGGRPKGSKNVKKVGTKAEDLLLAVAAEIGLAHALEILEGQRRKVLAVLGG
jgi:hypothetical protein